MRVTEVQYQYIQEEIKYLNRIHLSEGILGGYELCLRVGIPNIFGGNLELKSDKIIDLGDVEWTWLNSK